MIGLSKPANPKLEARLIKKLAYGVFAGILLGSISILIVTFIADAIMN